MSELERESELERVREREIIIKGFFPTPNKSRKTIYLLKYFTNSTGA